MSLVICIDHNGRIFTVVYSVAHEQYRLRTSLRVTAETVEGIAYLDSAFAIKLYSIGGTNILRINLPVRNATSFGLDQPCHDVGSQ